MLFERHTSQSCQGYYLIEHTNKTTLCKPSILCFKKGGNGKRDRERLTFLCSSSSLIVYYGHLGNTLHSFSPEEVLHFFTCWTQTIYTQLGLQRDKNTGHKCVTVSYF